MSLEHRKWKQERKQSTKRISVLLAAVTAAVSLTAMVPMQSEAAKKDIVFRYESVIAKGDKQASCKAKVVKKVSYNAKEKSALATIMKKQNAAGAILKKQMHNECV